MAQAERVEVLVLGSGTGGKLMAWDMAKAGHRTAVVERKWIGGSCPNVNCLPSKNEVKSAEVADVVHHAGAFGTVVAAARTDLAQVLARKRKMVEGAGSPQFTHVSENDFHIIRENLDGGDRTTRGRVVPFCLFTDPPLARVGLNEVEARRRGVPVRVATLQAREILRAWTTGETRGFMKALVHAQRDDILGFTMFGADAGEVVAVVQTAMWGGLPFTTLRGAMFTHPTMAEGLGTLFGKVAR